jgi:hypothetical protein
VARGRPSGARFSTRIGPPRSAADFVATEVWTSHGLLTYYIVFVIELHSRRVHVAGSTRHDAFVAQAIRGVTMRLTAYSRVAAC